MITNFNKKNRKDDIKLLCLLIFAFIFIIWLCTPPGNKFAQIALYGNNTQLLFAKLTKPSEELNEWLFHRNNAIYFVRMDNKNSALKEINKAINTYPTYLPEAKLLELYLIRAQIRLCNKDYNAALNDYMRLKSLSLFDKLRVALLFKESGNNKYAISYCNDILNSDPAAYIGYACIADIYASAGRYDTAVKIYDLLIDRSKNRAKYYAERAEYKKMCGDTEGYIEDLKTAKSISSDLGTNFSIIQEALSPKNLDFEIIKI